MGCDEETREQAIARMEASGQLVKDCQGCQERYEAPDPTRVWAPHHKASERCQSGKLAHCTCSCCF